MTIEGLQVVHCPYCESEQVSRLPLQEFSGKLQDDIDIVMLCLQCSRTFHLCIKKQGDQVLVGIDEVAEDPVITACRSLGKTYEQKMAKYEPAIEDLERRVALLEKRELPKKEVQDMHAMSLSRVIPDNHTALYLGRAGVTTVGDLLKLSKEDVLQIRGIGLVSLRSIRHGLKQLGLDLGVSMPKRNEYPKIRAKLVNIQADSVCIDPRVKRI